MEKYLGVKLVEAEEQKMITSGKIGEYGDLVETYKEGYKVVYEDEYTSWSPKDVFEKDYRKQRSLTEIPINEFQKLHEQRVFDEAWDLESKLAKLDIFIRESEIFKLLQKEEQVRLEQQLLAMKYYLAILVERIENF